MNSRWKDMAWECFGSQRERGWSVFSMQYPLILLFSVATLLLTVHDFFLFTYSFFHSSQEKTFPDQLRWRRGSCPEVCNDSEHLFVHLFIRSYYMSGVKYIYFINLSLQRGKKCQYPVFQIQELEQRVVQ